MNKFLFASTSGCAYIVDAALLIGVGSVSKPNSEISIFDSRSVRCFREG